jgi:hypothetical protein
MGDGLYMGEGRAVEAGTTPHEDRLEVMVEVQHGVVVHEQEKGGRHATQRVQNRVAAILNSLGIVLLIMVGVIMVTLNVGDDVMGRAMVGASRQHPPSTVGKCTGSPPGPATSMGDPSSLQRSNVQRAGSSGTWKVVGKTCPITDSGFTAWGVPLDVTIGNMAGPTSPSEVAETTCGLSPSPLEVTNGTMAGPTSPSEVVETTCELYPSPLDVTHGARAGPTSP